MRGREWVAGAAVVLLSVGSALPQSIGEVVERDKKRREALKGKTGKSYGDADLAARRPTPEPVAEVLYDPNSSYASCLAEALRGKDFPPPPSESFWFSVGMQWTAP